MPLSWILLLSVCMTIVTVFLIVRMHKDMEDEYLEIDEFYCGHCEEYTEHKCHYSDHERDSSHDYFECQKCSHVSAKGVTFEIGASFFWPDD